jgi:hypothetical protein
MLPVRVARPRDKQEEKLVHLSLEVGTVLGPDLLFRPSVKHVLRRTLLWQDTQSLNALAPVVLLVRWHEGTSGHFQARTVYAFGKANEEAERSTLAEMYAAWFEGLRVVPVPTCFTKSQLSRFERHDDGRTHITLTPGLLVAVFGCMPVQETAVSCMVDRPGMHHTGNNSQHGMEGSLKGHEATYLAFIHLAVVACLDVSNLARLLRALDNPGLLLAWG